MTTAENTSSVKSPFYFDINRIRRDFPIFAKPINGKPLIYLDNAATTQKPQVVINAIVGFYTQECASVHRGVYYLSERATESFENSREKVRRFINAASPREIVFVRGTTEGVNLIAQTYGRTHVKSGDEILISTMEHHSNIVPWQMLCEEKGAHLRVTPMNPTGELVFEQYAKLLSSKTRLVALTYVSNSLGTINPIQKFIQLAHKHEVPVLIDAAQAAPHISIDVQALDCDFLVFSGHKMYGPNGIGVLYGKERLLEVMPPYQTGGDMIRSVTMEKTLYREIPCKFEAGTPNVAGAIGLGASIDYLQALGMDNIAMHERELMTYAAQALQTVSELRIIGNAKEKSGIISFLIDGCHPHDIGTILDKDGIAIRAGHQCAQPVMDFFGITATARASLGLYNFRDDIDALLLGLRKVKEVFR